mmetsp:Transcript_20836/g.35094  ORF Transcript_20836/g.35094 Transcript_20836/m.35094 type:complete len:203 (+) Transcript_20836:672-1280(+)
MLARLSAQLTPNSGVLFLILPTKCINNEFLSHKQFLQFLKAVNLVVPNSENECYAELFPRATSDATFDDFCTRLTPKLSFFVLVHAPESVTPLLSACSMSKDTLKRQQKVNATEEWYAAEPFHHILKAVRMADHAGLLNHFKLTNASNTDMTDALTGNKKRKKKEMTFGRFNSSEFRVNIPPALLTTATTLVNIQTKNKKRV